MAVSDKMRSFKKVSFFSWENLYTPNLARKGMLDTTASMLESSQPSSPWKMEDNGMFHPNKETNHVDLS